jgi:hypothetical protein
MGSPAFGRRHRACTVSMYCVNQGVRLRELNDARGSLISAVKLGGGLEEWIDTRQLFEDFS